MTFAEPTPFAEAVDFVRAKSLLPTSMGSARLRELEASVQRRSAFSARMSDASFLQQMKELVESVSSGVRDAKEGVYISPAEAKAQLKEALEAAGWRTNPDDFGTIKDFYSEARRRLIVETNVLDTLGAGRFVAERDPVALDVNPGWELIRVSEPKTMPRDWQARWAAAGDAVGWEGASPDVMIALKTSPIWQALGNGAGGYEDTLGNPWAPFAFNSGMNVVQVSREECEDLGLLEAGAAVPGDRTPPDGGPLPDDGMDASLKAFDAELRSLLAADPALQVSGDRVRLAAGNSRSYERDHLGRFAGDGSPLGERDNIARGNKAVASALRNRRDVPRAMQVKDLGDVDLPWGTPGDKANDYKGGFGVSHILAKHGEAAVLRLPEVLAKGKVTRRADDPVKRDVTYKNDLVVLVKEKSSSSWVLTSFESKKLAAGNCFTSGHTRQVDGRGNILRPPYALQPSFGAAGEGAAKTCNITRSRSAVNAILEQWKEAA